MQQFNSETHFQSHSGTDTVTSLVFFFKREQWFVRFADQHEQPCAVWLRCCLCGKLERDSSFVASDQNQRDVGAPPGGTPAISRTWYQLSGLMLAPQSTAAAFSIGNDSSDMSDGCTVWWEASVTSSAEREQRHQEGSTGVQS